MSILPIFGVTAFQGVQNIVTIDPEKSRDFSFKNPGILVDVKSRDPGIPGIPLGPAAVKSPQFRIKLDSSNSGPKIKEETWRLKKK